MGNRASFFALLTDFGTRDAYAASVKGVLFTACPKMRVIDITHDIPPGNVLSAAYVLAGAWDYLPPRTVVLAVVDPGVGTSRGALAAAAGGRYLIAPDNGMVSFLVRLKGADLTAWELKTDFLKTEPAATFHGRDVFAPAAVLLARGQGRRVLGRPVTPAVLAQASSKRGGDGVVHGMVVHVDRFGNAVTSIRADEIVDRENAEVEFTARGRFVKEPYRVRLRGIHRTYGDVAAGQPLVYTGSLGFLELGVRDGSAAEKLGVRQGAPVRAGARSAGI